MTGNESTGKEGTSSPVVLDYFPAAHRPSNPICSICIANYNGMLLLAECLKSIEQQGCEASVEVIIHDDASTDNSVAWLRENYSNVEVLASRENVGFCIANNRMLAHARSEYVLLLNNDAALFPDAITTLLEVARASPASGILTLPQYNRQTGNLIDRGCMLDLFYNPVPNLDPSRREVAITIGACLFLPRALWFDLGGFPEWMGSIAEDMYLCCCARLRGISVRVTSTSGYVHRQGASFGGNRVDAGKLSTTYRRRRLSECNKSAVMVICTPTALVWPLLIVHLCALFFEGTVLSLLKRERRIWLEIYAPTFGFIARELLPLRIRRHKVQCTRQVTLRVYFREFIFMPRKLSMLWRYGLPTVR